MHAMGRRLVGLVVMGALAGCTSRLTGNEGNLEFSYPADDNIRDFNKPVAVGAKLQVTVAQAGTSKQVELTSAKSSADTVLAVNGFSADKVVVEGKGAGSALISVEARLPDGKVVPDSVNMLARVPEVLKLTHTCTNELEGRYFPAQDILVPFDLEMKNGQPVIGYGYHPVDTSPAGALVQDVTTQDQQFFHFKTPTTKQLITLTSKLGDGATLKLQLVEAGQVDGAVLGPGTPGPTAVGNDGYYHVLPTVGGKPVCQPITPMTAASTTPSICDAAAVTTHPSGPVGEHAWVKVTGKAVGKCTFNLTVTQGAAGAGVTVPLTVDVLQIVR